MHIYVWIYILRKHMELCDFQMCVLCVHWGTFSRPDVVAPTLGEGFEHFFPAPADIHISLTTLDACGGYERDMGLKWLALTQTPCCRRLARLKTFNMYWQSGSINHTKLLLVAFVFFRGPWPFYFAAWRLDHISIYYLSRYIFYYIPGGPSRVS